MNRKHFFDRFDLDNDEIINKQVHTKTGIYGDFSISNRQRQLSRDNQASRLKFVSQALLVHGFEQAGPERNVNGKGRVHDLARDFVECLTRLIQILGALASWRFTSISFAILNVSMSP